MPFEGSNMKNFLYLIILTLFTSLTYAESALETDDSFFSGSKAPYEDDDLDRAHKKNEISKVIERQKKTETEVKDEFTTARPNTMSTHEARAMDERIVAENKRRQSSILNSIKSSAALVQSCVNQNPQHFQGTHATVIWMIGADGRIMDSAIKTTDIENGEIQKCIQDVAMKLDFSNARTDLLKKTHAEYTYKFKKLVVKKTAQKPAKKPTRKTASQ